MAQRQFRYDDTDKWKYGYGKGADGALTVSGATTFASSIAGCSGAAGQKNVTVDAASSFANGDLVLIHQSRGANAGKWELNKIASGGGTTSLVMTHDLCNTYADSGNDQAQIVELKEYSSITINAGASWNPVNWDGSKGGIIAAICSGTTTINGTVNLVGNNSSASSPYGSVAGAGFRGGEQVGADNATGYQAEGSASPSQGQTQSANGSAGGAGRSQGGAQGAGGGGSNRTAGANGNGSYIGTGATAITSTADGVLMTFGGGGGGSAGSADWSRNAGGTGGGIFFLITKNFVVNNSTGSVNLNGGKNSVNKDTSGGGGAGGFGLVKCETYDIGTNRMTADGGQPTGNYSQGGKGGLGGLAIDYRKSGTGTTSTPAVNLRQDSSLKYPGGAAILNQLLG